MRDDQINYKEKFHKKTPNKSLYNVSQKKENVKKKLGAKKRGAGRGCPKTNIWRLKKYFKKRKTPNRNQTLY